MNGPFTFDTLVALAGSHLRCDVACPQCGPAPGRTATNRKRCVLRIWHPEPSFVTFHCERCGISGHAIDNGREPVSRADLEKIRAKAEAFDREEAAKQLETARWLWSNSRPIVGTIAERYLREEREISGTLPATLRFKPATNGYPPALIGAFGLPVEPEPGVLMISRAQVEGVHLTRLKPDGSGKHEREDEPAKIMIARSRGWPLVLAPLNDNGGLGIVEGIEDGLTVLAATGLGMWVAGSASRLPALAERVPTHVDCITIFADGDNAGMTNARELERRLRARGLFTTIAELPENSR
jgi:Toprim domain